MMGVTTYSVMVISCDNCLGKKFGEFPRRYKAETVEDCERIAAQRGWLIMSNEEKSVVLCNACKRK